LSLEELCRLYRDDFNDVVYDKPPEDLGLLLQKVGAKVEEFFANMSNTIAKEHLVLQRLNAEGRTEKSLETDFSYLLTVRSDIQGNKIDEDRTDSQGQSVRLIGRREIQAKLQQMSNFMVTSGHATMSIYLHPDHQAGSHFRYLGRQVTAPRALLIAFAQKPEKRDFQSRIGYEILTPVLLQGLVWVDARTFQIVRMKTDLLEPALVLGVLKMTTEIWLTEVSLKENSQRLSVPRLVKVTAICILPGAGSITFRSTHSYSNYRLFTVESTIKYDKILPPPVKK
jgi:hypothetical protein